MSETEIGETEENPKLYVADPDDYQKTKQLKMIHDAKQEVLKVRNNRSDIIVKLDDEFSDRGYETYQHRLALTVAQYGSELLPLIEEGIEKDVLGKDDLSSQLASDLTEMDIMMFIQMDGRIEYNDNIDYPPEPNIMGIYRQLNRIQRKLGLGLELQEDKGPAKI